MGFDGPKGPLVVINFARVDGDLEGGWGSSTLLRLMGENGGGVSTLLRLIGKKGEGAGGTPTLLRLVG